MGEEAKTNNILNNSKIESNGNSDSDVTYFAQTNFRNERRSFGIKRADRTKHMYIIGKTGMGKSTVEENMAIQDIQRGEGVGVVDPHGQFAEKMLSFVPENRIKDVIYFCPHDTDWPMAFNIMEDVGMEQRHFVASGLMLVFKKIWPDVWSARMEYILNNCILALLEYPDSTILGINRMLSDKDYRKEVISKITDPVVKAFWEQEFARYTDKFMTEAGAAIQNKVGQFISNPLIRNIIGQPKSSFDMRKIMDEKKIFIMNLSKGRIGESNSQLIGAMLITKLYISAMSRVDIPEKEREDFYLYVDEFQNFATESFKDILSEARKYKLDLILAHQYITQMDESVRDAVFGNVGTMVVFRVGAFDAEVLETEFSPEFMATDIVNLGFANIYLKLMISGVASRPFSAMTLSPIPHPEKSYINEIIDFSRKSYANPKAEVEKRISEWHASVVKSSAEDGTKGDMVKVPKSFKSAEKTDEGVRSAFAGPQIQLYEAVCSACGVTTQVPFKPDGKRPIYCKDCKEKYLNKEGVAPVPKIFPVEKKTFSAKQLPSKEERIPPWRGRPAFDEGEIVQRKAPIAAEEISLEKLKTTPSKNHFIKREENIKKVKANPDLSSLRHVLEDALTPTSSDDVDAKKSDANNKGGILKPGDSIKF